MEKTKVIWIGRKRFSKEKLSVTAHLNWGSTDFTLLGIDFSTNLPCITERNYQKALEKIKKLVKIWNNRYLTPIGKITIIKTYLISQCVHMLSCLPRSNSFLKELNKILYKFLWNNKPDKIRRSTVILDKTAGGMQMIDPVSFDISLKGNWIQKLYAQTNSQWYKLLVSMYKGIDHIFNFGDQWIKKMQTKVQNRFWQDVLDDWNSLITAQKLKNKNQIIRSSLWYNSDISQHAIFF